MENSAGASKSGQVPDRRLRSRSTSLSNPMVEIKLEGGPLYQLKVKDLSNEGAGIVVRSDSNFLNRIQVGQSLHVHLILPVNYKGPSGHYRSRVEHITEIAEGPFSGHLVVGISILPGATAK